MNDANSLNRSMTVGMIKRALTTKRAKEVTLLSSGKEETKIQQVVTDKATGNVFQTLSESAADSLLEAKPALTHRTLPIRNLGNTCFANSTIQCLTHITPFLNFCLTDHAHRDHICQSKLNSCFLCHFKSYFRTISAEKKTDPFIFIQNLNAVWPRYNYLKQKTQEDAHEFLTVIIENLIDSCF